MKILLIEDDSDIANIVRLNVVPELGASLEVCDEGVSGLAAALNNEYEVIILDLMLPGLGGLEICKKIREENKFVPLLMLTAKSEEIDRVIGLEVGADDYLTKPFSVRELVARVKALHRRASVIKSRADTLDDEAMTFAELFIDPLNRRVLLNEEEVLLTQMEFDVIEFLARHPGRPFSREELAEKVWQRKVMSYEATINAQLSRLRKKIEADPENPRFIKTVWGIGYRFARLDELEEP